MSVMKITMNQTSVFEDLQKAWKKLAGSVTKSVFSIFDKKSYDEATDTLTVKHPDITSDKPLVKGTVRMMILDRNKVKGDIDNPTWKDVAEFFSNFRDGDNKRLIGVKLVNSDQATAEGKTEKVKVLELHSAE